MATPLRPSKSLHDPIPKLKERKRYTHRKDTTETPEPSHISGDLSDEQDGIEGSENESITGRHDGNVKTVRQRHRTSETKIPDQADAEDNHPMSGKRAFWQTQEGPFLSVIVNDGWILIKTALRLPMLLYPFWKWLLLTYVVWMAIMYLVTLVGCSATAALAPMCSTWFIGPKIPFCSVSSEPKDRPINVLKVATSQDVLTVVMDRVGQNFDLARDMVGHEFAVRDLRIRVAASNLSCKKELTRELESLIRYTKHMAK